jgi:hypothetical protein
MSASAVITLTTQPNPYEVDGPTSWLSVDLQVFNVLQNGSLPSTPAIQLNSGPNNFIRDLLTKYNDPTLPRAPGHPFDLDLVAHEDTSAVEIAGSVGMVPVYNFAVARVRYRALATPADNVRVFFRIFQASTTSTDFQPSTTYLTGGLAGVKIPLLGVVAGEVVSIPCFAAGRVDPTNPNGLNAQQDPLNVGPLGNPIPPDGSGAEVQVYFGCWLDINQNVPVLPASPASAAGPFTPVQSIQQAIKNRHQCLVAEINLDPPEPQIATGETPALSDKLAQRNLNIVGVASPHLVPNTFDIKPTPAGLPPNQMPDELMIDWGNVPAGTQAAIYLPQLEARAILNTANRLYSHHALSRLDDHTLGCKAAGITYLPIPPGTGSNYAGLLTLDLPSAVRREQVFRVVARQITNTLAVVPQGQPPETPRALAQADVIRWRKVLGSFQVSIPVSTKPALLEPEQRLLAVLRWIAKTIPADSRWYPVFQRYLEQVEQRVDSLGGNSSQIGASSSGDWQADLRCRRRGWLVAAFLGPFLASLGALTGAALATAAPVLGLFLILMTVFWIKKCHPRRSRWLSALIAGLGLGAALLAILALLGVGAPQLVPFLCALTIVLALFLLVWLLT